MEEKTSTQYLIWKIKIQLLAMQLSTAKHEGISTWLNTILSTLTEINQLATCYGPFDYQTPPAQPWPPYLARPVKGGILYATVIRELEALFGNVTHAAIMRIEPEA